MSESGVCKRPETLVADEHQRARLWNVLLDETEVLMAPVPLLRWMHSGIDSRMMFSKRGADSAALLCDSRFTNSLYGDDDSVTAPLPEQFETSAWEVLYHNVLRMA